MQPPDSLLTLIDEGIIEEVVRPLMSGKEAQVYLVRTNGGLRVAKVYKDAQKRSFKQKADYTEGRGVRNSRDRRAMTKRTRYGREQDEAAWRSAEVDMMYRLSAAGVRVPTPYHFIEGVLVMELVCDEDGDPAPRLGELDLEPAAARKLFDAILAEVVRMLAAGVVHGDLSDFNVLVGADGPVIIDFPQSIEASMNQNARKLLIRDVDNLHNFLMRFFPGHRAPPLAQEMWRLYERGKLTPDTKLQGRFHVSQKAVSTDEVLGLIADADQDERKRRQSSGQGRKGGSQARPVLATGNGQGEQHSLQRPSRVASHAAEGGRGAVLPKKPGQSARPPRGLNAAAQSVPRQTAAAEPLRDQAAAAAALKPTTRGRRRRKPLAPGGSTTAVAPAAPQRHDPNGVRGPRRSQGSAAPRPAPEVLQRRPQPKPQAASEQSPVPGAADQGEAPRPKRRRRRRRPGGDGSGKAQ